VRSGEIRDKRKSAPGNIVIKASQYPTSENAARKPIGLSVVGRQGAALQQTLALGLLARQLALATNAFSFLAGFAHGRLFKMLLKRNSQAPYPIGLRGFVPSEPCDDLRW
jgi:hypothetical protein